MFWSITHSWVGFFNNGDHWSVTHSTVGSHWSITLHIVEYPLVCYIQFNGCMVRLVQSPWKRVFIVCRSSHAWDQRVWTGSQREHRAAGGVMESVKDGHQASFLKTLPSQSCISLCIISIMQPGRRECFYHLNVSVNALHQRSLLQVSSALAEK